MRYFDIKDFPKLYQQMQNSPFTAGYELSKIYPTIVWNGRINKYAICEKEYTLLVLKYS